jgi:hypothetical protein
MDLRSVPMPTGAVSPVFQATPKVAGRLFFGFGLSTAGFYYLGSGKKQQDVQKMILGAALILAALVLF